MLGKNNRAVLILGSSLFGYNGYYGVLWVIGCAVVRVVSIVHSALPCNIIMLALTHRTHSTHNTHDTHRLRI
jgi:hypothetical protein